MLVAQRNSTGETLTDNEELSLHRESRFWQLSPVKWWIQGHGRGGYSFRLLLVPLVIVFVLEFVCVMFDALYSGIVVSAVATLFLGIAGFFGAQREWLVTSAAARALVKARMKKAAERFSSLGVGATVLAIFVAATSLSLVMSGQPMLDSVSKDAVSIFIALVFLPVYVSGAVRKLAIARIEELEALRNATVGTQLKFDRAGAVRAVVVQGAAGKGTVSVTEYTVLGFSPPLEQVGREPRA
ncbi:ABC transporter permease [Burkholderia sp. IT-111MI5]